MASLISKATLWTVLALSLPGFAHQAVRGAEPDSGSATAPELVFPEPGMSSPLFEMNPVFTWRPPLNESASSIVAYRLEISQEDGFESPRTAYKPALDRELIDLAVSDSLALGSRYWWRVAAIHRDGTIVYSDEADFWTWLPGDIDHSHAVDIGDLVFIVNYMFAGAGPPSPSFIMDVNGDCIAPDVTDLIYLVSYMFGNGAAPKAGCLNRSGLL